MLNVFLLFTNTFLRLLFFLAGLIPQLLQKSHIATKKNQGRFKQPFFKLRDVPGTAKDYGCGKLLVFIFDRFYRDIGASSINYS